jgi:hypothetical protein
MTIVTEAYYMDRAMQSIPLDGVAEALMGMVDADADDKHLGYCGVMQRWIGEWEPGVNMECEHEAELEVAAEMADELTRDHTAYVPTINGYSRDIKRLVLLCTSRGFAVAQWADGVRLQPARTLHGIRPAG